MNDVGDSSSAKSSRAYLRRTVQLLLGRSWILALALGAIVALLPWLGVQGLWIYWLALTGINGLVVSGLNLTFGYAGEFAFGQIAMFAAGAYGAAYVELHGTHFLLAGLAVGALCGAVVGVVSGIPGSRLGEWPLAMISFFLVIIIPNIVNLIPSITGGAPGLVGLGSPTLIGPLDTRDLYVVIIVIFALWLSFLRNYILSRQGIALRVLSASPLLLRSLGLSPYRLRLTVYVIGSIPAGLAGALFAYFYQFVAPGAFTFSVAIGIFAASMLGGSGTIYGAIVGSLVLQGIPLISGGFTTAALLVYGCVLLLGGLAFRQGIVGVVAAFFDRRTSWSSGRLLETPAMARSHRGGVMNRALPWVLQVRGQALVLDSIEKSFGGVAALSGVSMRVEPGQITALIGANGSGKTTLLNIVSGFERPDKGRVMLGGEDIGNKSDVYRARLLGRTFQTPWIPPGLSTVGVVASGRLSAERSSVLSAATRSRRHVQVEDRDLSAALSALKMMDLLAVADAEAVSLPLGVRRLVEVGRALVRLPAVFLFDEPAAGLDEDEKEKLIEVMQRLKDAGATVLLVEHNMSLVEAAADTVYLLDLGKVVASGSYETVRVSADGIEEMYLRERGLNIRSET